MFFFRTKSGYFTI